MEKQKLYSREKPGDHYLNQVIKVNIPRNGRNKYNVLPDMRHGKQISLLWYSSLKCATQI